MLLQNKVRTCFWFAENGSEAADFYVSLLPESRIDNVVRPGADAQPLVIEFTLAGCPLMILNGGPEFKPTPAASISVLTKDQAETDRIWASLVEGGKEGRCGWLTDRFGVSWQIVPERLPRLLTTSDAGAAERVRSAFHQMNKVDIAALEAAHAG